MDGGLRIRFRPISAPEIRLSDKANNVALCDDLCAESPSKIRQTKAALAGCEVCTSCRSICAVFAAALG